MNRYTRYLVDAVHAAVDAGRAILEVYQTDFSVETKTDNSPLTLADKRSHEIIKERLKGHGIPSISEEGRGVPYEERRNWNTVWIVDPLDGTKEFVKRNGEFTVNIALVENQKAVMGVVYAPVPQWLYFGSAEIGAYKMVEVQDFDFQSCVKSSPEDGLNALTGNAKKLPLVHSPNAIYTIVGSRSHGTAELTAFVEKKKKEKGEVKFIQAGSSLKICLVAEGTADIYPRLGPTMEWDTAAGQGVTESAGATIGIYESDQPLKYNKPDLLNPWFVVRRNMPDSPCVHDL